jgi:hypothetical protein
MLVSPSNYKCTHNFRVWSLDLRLSVKTLVHEGSSLCSEHNAFGISLSIFGLRTWYIAADGEVGLRRWFGENSAFSCRRTKLWRWKERLEPITGTPSNLQVNLSFLRFRALQISVRRFCFFEFFWQLDQTFLAFMLLRRNHNVRGSIYS